MPSPLLTQHSAALIACFLILSQADASTAFSRRWSPLLRQGKSEHVACAPELLRGSPSLAPCPSTPLSTLRITPIMQSSRTWAHSPAPVRRPTARACVHCAAPSGLASLKVYELKAVCRHATLTALVRLPILGSYVHPSLAALM
eukprot:2008382-Pleurochrysis_carterae.AAC.1